MYIGRYLFFGAGEFGIVALRNGNHGEKFQTLISNTCMARYCKRPLISRARVHALKCMEQDSLLSRENRVMVSQKSHGGEHYNLSLCWPDVISAPTILASS